MEAKRDENNVTTITGVLNSDGETIVVVEADPTTHGLSVNNATTGSDNGPIEALRDENFVPTLLAVSGDDGETIVPLYVDSDGKLLIDET